MADTSRVWGLHKPTHTWWDHIVWVSIQKAKHALNLVRLDVRLKSYEFLLVSTLKGKHCSQKVVDVLHKNISRLYSSFQWIGFHGKFYRKAT
jgi:hypothetical protein